VTVHCRTVQFVIQPVHSRTISVGSLFSSDAPSISHSISSAFLSSRGAGCRAVRATSGRQRRLLDVASRIYLLTQRLSTVHRAVGHLSVGGAQRRSSLGSTESLCLLIGRLACTVQYSTTFIGSCRFHDVAYIHVSSALLTPSAMRSCSFGDFCTVFKVLLTFIVV